MLFSLFKNKWFWIVWLILSLTGGVIGYVLSEKREIKLNNAESAICVEFRNLSHPSIWGISDLKDKDEYLKVMLDSNIKTHNIPLIKVVENNQSVKILGYSDDSSLVHIAIVRENGTLTKSRYEELWLWNKFINNK